MLERTSAIPAWAWIVGAVLVIVSVFAGYRMVQTQQHLVAAQSELESAKQAVEKANAKRKELTDQIGGRYIRGQISPIRACGDQVCSGSSAKRT